MSRERQATEAMAWVARNLERDLQAMRAERDQLAATVRETRPYVARRAREREYPESVRADALGLLARIDALTGEGAQ